MRLLYVYLLGINFTYDFKVESCWVSILPVNLVVVAVELELWRRMPCRQYFQINHVLLQSRSLQ